MSSDDELYRGTSLAYPPQPSATTVGPDSPKLGDQDDGDRRGSLNGNISNNTTANDVANSDERVRQIGLSVLLNRLKQDVATCKELATVIKKRALLEDEHGKSLQKLAKTTQDTLKRTDIKQQGFNRHLFQATRSWDESTAASLQFAAQLHLMVDEITELSKTSDRKRKGLKHEALRDETNVTSAEGVAEKARIKHEGLVQDLERAISASRGESFPSTKGRFGMTKKSGVQLIKHEEDLRGKVLEADRDMQNKQQMAADLRRELMNTLRPRNVKNLVDLVTETDSALSFHLQKFAVLTETLAANQGTAVLPMAIGRLGFTALIGQTNDGRDFRDYVLEFSSKVPPSNKRYSGPAAQNTYSDMPSLPSTYGRSGPPQLPQVDAHVNRGEFVQEVQRASNGAYLPPLNFQQPPQHPALQQYQAPATYSSSNQSPQPQQTSTQPTTYIPSSSQSSPRSPHVPVHQPTGEPNLNPNPPYQPSSSIQQTPASAFVPPPSFSAPTPPPEKHIPPLQLAPPASVQQAQSVPASGTSRQTGYNSPKPTTPQGHTFGIPLDEVISRENATLPLIVAQCVIAVDQFGLTTEGIYRVSGSVSTLAKLKQMFDFEPDHIDFRTPAGFFGDIHAVAGILKQYLRELPDPLLTKAYYSDFIRVARILPCWKALTIAIEPDFHRRDAIHSLVNDLPDANYSCLRTLALHLHKISQHADQNKMTVQNLAKIFGPTLLGSESTGIEDARAQIRVAETIITYATDMFELGNLVVFRFNVVEDD